MTNSESEEPKRHYKKGVKSINDMGEATESRREKLFPGTRRRENPQRQGLSVYDQEKGKSKKRKGQRVGGEKRPSVPVRQKVAKANQEQPKKREEKKKGFGGHAETDEEKGTEECVKRPPVGY